MLVGDTLSFVLQYVLLYLLSSAALLLMLLPCFYTWGTNRTHLPRATHIAVQAAQSKFTDNLTPVSSESKPEKI